MTGFLIRCFIKQPEAVADTAVRSAYGKLAGIVGIICNLFLFAFKFIVGTISGSVSITADAVNNLSDASSSIISLLGFKLSEKAADPEHPYGHARFEYLSGLFVSVLILLIGLELFKSSFTKILHPEDVEFSWIAMVVLAAAILVKVWMAVFNIHIGKKIDSKTLMTTAADSRNDVITTLAVMAAALISYFTDVELDGYMGVAVAVFILFSGIGLVKDTLDPLLGQAPDPAFVQMIEERILNYPGVLGMHDLMVHDYGPGRQFASVHVEMAAERDVLESHDIIDNIENDFWTKNHLHVSIHFDPIVTADHEVADLKQWLSEKVKDIDMNMSIHDLRIVPGTTHTNVIFDCVVPFSVTLKSNELREKLESFLREKGPQYNAVVSFDRDYAGITHHDDDY